MWSRSNAFSQELETQKIRGRSDLTQKTSELILETIDRLVESIREFGFTSPILLDEANVILAGHRGGRPREKPV